MRSDTEFAKALVAAIESDGDIYRAVAYFKQISARPFPHNIKKFIQRVWDRYKDGEIKIAARATPKRTKLISDEQAQQASDMFLQGVQGPSGWRPAGSAKQACMENEGLKAIIKETGCSPTQLWTRAKQVNPKLQTVHIPKNSKIKPTLVGIITTQRTKAEALTQADKNERLRKANKHMQRSIKVRMCDTYIDEGAIMIGNMPTLQAITEKGKRMQSGIPLPRAMQMPSSKFPKEACGKLHFVIAIHPNLGLVYLDFLSSTTDHPMHGCYKKSDGRSYKGISSKEFSKVMKEIMATLRTLQTKHPKNFLGGVKVVLNNMPFHSAEIEKLGKRALEIPPKSPEFQKPVTRVIRAIKTEFWKRYAEMLSKPDNPGYIPFKRAKSLLRRVVKAVVKPENIAKDVHAMLPIYKAIADAKGG